MLHHLCFPYLQKIFCDDPAAQMCRVFLSGFLSLSFCFFSVRYNFIFCSFLWHLKQQNKTLKKRYTPKKMSFLHMNSYHAWDLDSYWKCNPDLFVHFRREFLSVDFIFSRTLPGKDAIGLATSSWHDACICWEKVWRMFIASQGEWKNSIDYMFHFLKLISIIILP